MLESGNPSLLRSVPPSQVLDYLYCGNLYNAYNKKQLGELKIEYILSLRSERGRINEKDYRYLHCPLDDFGQSDLSKIWMECFDFISEAKSNQKNILVHCDGGINRSPTIVVGYLVSREQWTLKQAFDHVLQVRPCVAPREHYLDQLRQLELSTRGEVSLNDINITTQEHKTAGREDLLRKMREAKLPLKNI